MNMQAEYRGTIPRLLAAAADRDSEGNWLRSDSGSLTFGGTVAAVGLTAEALTAAGVRRGDLVMMTARSTPPLAGIRRSLVPWISSSGTGRAAGGAAVRLLGSVAATGAIAAIFSVSWQPRRKEKKPPLEMPVA